MPKKEEIANERPLFQVEVRRNKNPRHAYDIKRNVDIHHVKNTRKPTTFGSSFGQYRRTCDIQSDIKIYDYAADKSNTEQYYPAVQNVKRKWPGYSVGKAKQFVLWEKDIKKSRMTPGPLTYQQSDGAIKPKRFNGIGLGLDIKCTLRDIELTPGAGDYNTV